MIPALIALQLVTLIAVVVLLLRKPTTTSQTAEDPRLAQLLAADLPTQFTRLDARSETLDRHLRDELTHLRNESADANKSLRSEVLLNISTLSDTIRTGLEGFRADDATASERLRLAVDSQLTTLTQRITSFTADSNRLAAEARDTLDSRLNLLGVAQVQQQDKLRDTVEKRLDALQQNNEKKLEEMRATVDEKLQSTLEARLTASFGQVAERLEKVHAGLGEMTSLTTGVNDLNRIFSNVKSRGGFAEVQLGKLLEQVLAPGQYVENANIRPNTLETVEFAVKFPGSSGDVLLPIDAKFPREDFERLETAYEKGSADEIESARRAFDNAIRTEGKRICSKYIHEPVTTPYAIMFLPTEGLYAEVLRRDGLQDHLHQHCRVMVAGPSNLYALLTSFQLGFRMLNLQKKGGEVWNVLASAQKEFRNFEDLMGSMERQVGTVQNTIQKLGVRTRAINKSLADVSHHSEDATPLPTGTHNAFDGLLPMLAANADQPEEKP